MLRVVLYWTIFQAIYVTLCGGKSLILETTTSDEIMLNGTTDSEVNNDTTYVTTSDEIMLNETTYIEVNKDTKNNEYIGIVNSTEVGVLFSISNCIINNI